MVTLSLIHICPAAWAKLPEEELFTPAGFSEERAEATSYSNYSYWGSRCV